MNEEEKDEWVNESEAAKRMGISQSTISRHIKKGRLQTRQSKRDERHKLVNMKELRELYKDTQPDD